ncbi:F-box protein CPR1-like [Cornus florida]|uniref:F-box protein CPR1-like n=1 Tax=Cornus florida TaxID=4283 RepID=UPI00289F85B3|nr:F-box protein CPR1-like [Cornus florida]
MERSKNPNFITAHINRTTADKKKTQLLLRYRSHADQKDHYSVRFDDETFDECMTLDSSYNMLSHLYYSLVGSCKGLICLRNNAGVVVWNPAIRKTLRLPKPPSSLSDRRFPCTVLVGFGFNSCTNDFKVIRMFQFLDLDTEIFMVPPVAEVYEISTGLSRAISAVPPYNMSSGKKSCSYYDESVFVKGASHWLLIENPNSILSFDMASEVFREVMFPASVANETAMSISIFRESLSLFTYDRDLWEYCIWVMKEYGVVESWTKLFTIGRQIGRVLGLRKTGEILVAKVALLSFDFGRELVSFDPVNKQQVNLGIRWSQCSPRLDTYMESLVLLDRKY